MATRATGIDRQATAVSRSQPCSDIRSIEEQSMTKPTPVTQTVLTQAKWAFSTRRVGRGDVTTLRDDLSQAVSGDLVLARVERIGSHKRVQLAEGRPSTLYVGDLVVVACGDRYASDQFEGIARLAPEGADLLAGGGVIGQMRQRHANMSPPTRLVPLGLLSDANGKVINLDRYALGPLQHPLGMTVIAVVGAAMNAGKTTAVASLAHGLSRAGHRVAALKATGTGAFGDFNAYVDAGAHYVADFVDAGMVSTYRQPLARIEAGIDTLMAHAAAEGCGVALIELADGVLQQETAQLIKQPHRRAGLDAVVFAAPDPLAAVGGTAALRSIGIEPAALTGMVSCSPLAVEEAEGATGVSVLTRAALCDPAFASALLARIESRSHRKGAGIRGAGVVRPGLGVAA
jgi:hypothetical protein